MFVAKSARLKGLSIVRIASNAKLVHTFGLKDTSGHPDNLDPERFNKPQNPSGTDGFDSLADAMDELERAAADSQRSDSGEAKESDE